MRPAIVLALLAAAVGSTACARQSRWHATDMPTPRDAELALTATSARQLSRDLTPSEIPDVPMRRRLRPCCAFGVDVGVAAGAVPVPGFRIGNIRSRNEIGRHTFDSGVLHLRPGREQRPFFNNENDGLVYTCRGGFIDTAHVRDYADWALYIGTRLARSLRTGTTVRLSDEGGTRTVVLKPIPGHVLERYDTLLAARALGMWITFQLSIWHETVTWFGWAAVPGFSERASAFSPEDLYSNLLGIRIAGAMAHRRSARSEAIYNKAFIRWLDEMLVLLGAVPKDIGREAMRSVDGVWWDSGKRLPDPNLVIRRSLDIEGPIEPWIVPEDRTSPELRAKLRKHCGGDPATLPLQVADSAGDIRFADYLSLRIEVDDDLAARSPFDALGREVTERDFPAIVRAIRKQNRAEFGAGSDRPD